ncbi:uncharacterized protein Tco025E_03879 [Trypanosoma conorhini]|uniref:Methyltransferase domain-containing protein n=1 Tax=Trypanosoma conorhini TaxID=83891 RepID=A0A3R7LSY7_9TRYP|nr:uncharacterized protein Tco025E_03879 [Trypanosoma conorhini]RNF20050.1 hypothetical protein Tco025E_03879 [Trypanosoma conorhini]
MAHRLLLPLPSAFSPPDSDVEAYGVFGYDAHAAAEQHPRLQAYIDRLAAFLCRTRLIQYHPENFFRILFLHEEREPTANAAERLAHLDGSAVRDEEVAYMRGLCEAFSTLVSDDNTLLGELHSIIHDGPPAGAAASLHEFFLETKALQLNRQRRLGNDAASLTLRTAQEVSVAATSLASSHAGHVDADAREQHRRARVMEAVLGHGMGTKKQHEVSVMRETIVDLVKCCNSAPSDAGAPPLEPVETVFNVGEGKGYVSRALALCDGLQVIGLDCNPAHKERAVERVEFLLQGRLRVDAAQGASAGREMLNLMYEPRGHMATVACRVGPRMNWAEVLRGHVRLSHETPSDAAAPRTASAVDGSAKLQCRICPFIARRGAAMAIMRHARRHLDTDDATVLAGLPSKETVEVWNHALSVEAFNEKVIAAFFTDEVLYTSKAAAEDTTSAKRSRVASEKGCLSGEAPRGKLRDALSTYECLTNLQLPRGTRAEVLLPVQRRKQQPPVTPPQQHEEEGEEKEQPLVVEGAVEGAGASDAAVHRYVQTSLTVVGYDHAANRHFVIRDDGSLKEAVTLLGCCRGPQREDGDSVEALRLPPAADAWEMKLAVVLRVVPPVSPRMPAVHVPDLRNVVMIGLHPCGDLGSSVCRLFAESASRGLLLVSCCWHAITHDGFPLSRELRGRGWQTEHLSLLLATQPFDMWSTVSTGGHRASVCALFYRSLLKLFWRRLRERWHRASAASAPAPAVPCCPFAEAPHLEPAFLRRIAKIRSTITMEALYVEVCREYFPGEAATARGTHATLQQHVCSSCREAQSAFLASDTNVAAAAEIGREFFAAYFAPFLGMTVLRMWMCHLVEALLLLDRALFLSEALRRDPRCRGSVVSLVPLFDGAVSPRMYGVLARRIPA